MTLAEIPQDSYRCAKCNGVFEKGWSDEEAEAERQELWPGAVARGEVFDQVCDPCFKSIGADQPENRQRYEEHR